MHGFSVVTQKLSDNSVAYNLVGCIDSKKITFGCTNLDGANQLLDVLNHRAAWIEVEECI